MKGELFRSLSILIILCYLCLLFVKGNDKNLQTQCKNINRRKNIF